MRKLRSIILQWDDGWQTLIEEGQIEKMVEASEALEMIERARQVAIRLSKLSEAK